MKPGSLAALMSVIAAAGGSRLNLAISWHRPIWVGRKRPATPEHTRYDLSRIPQQPARRRSRSRWNAQ